MNLLSIYLLPPSLPYHMGELLVMAQLKARRCSKMQCPPSSILTRKHFLSLRAKQWVKINFAVLLLVLHLRQDDLKLLKHFYSVWLAQCFTANMHSITQTSHKHSIVIFIHFSTWHFQLNTRHWGFDCNCARLKLQSRPPDGSTTQYLSRRSHTHGRLTRMISSSSPVLLDLPR